MAKNELIEKIQTQKQWNTTPCGSIGEISENLDYFTKVEKNRYITYGDWMQGFYKYENHQGVKLLEVGFGQGTDLVQYAKGGADCYGIDLTQRHYELASKNFEVRGLKANLTLGDAANLPFEDNTFDKIVSFGVLHHTPDIEDCVAEIHRVLKPGGIFIISLYHKHSIHHYWSKLLLQGIIKGKLFTIGYKGLLATIEKGADGKDIKPYVKLYSTSSLRTLLVNFSTIKVDIQHLYQREIYGIGKLIPQSLLSKLSTLFGWYIIGTARKNQ